MTGSLVQHHKRVRPWENVDLNVQLNVFGRMVLLLAYQLRVFLLHIMILRPEILPESCDMLICKMSYRKSYFQRLLLMLFGANWVTATISSLSCCEISSILHQSELLKTGIIQEIHRFICCMALDELAFLKI